MTPETMLLGYVVGAGILTVLAGFCFEKFDIPDHEWPHFLFGIATWPVSMSIGALFLLGSVIHKLTAREE